MWLMRQCRRVSGSSRTLCCFSRCHSRWATPGAQKCPLLLAHGLPQWHVYFLGLFAFCLDVVRDYRMGPKCCQLLPLVASQILSKGPCGLCVHRPSPPRGLIPQQSSELCRAQLVTQSCRKRCGIGSIGMLGCAEEKQIRKSKRQMHYWFPALHLRSLAKNSQRT